MNKEHTYKCSNCDYKGIKWLGCCPQCKEWNSISEYIPSIKNSTDIELTQLCDIQTVSKKRMLSGIGEWDRVTGGGLVPGEFLIITGDPGIGKSTLLLQIAHHLSNNYAIFYFSSEESLDQVKLRAERLNYCSENLLFSDQANLDNIISISQTKKPNIIIIDSIQNCFTKESQTIPGSIGQLKESAFKLMRLAKEYSITILVSGHITKEGIIAGPKTLEHMVDAVFYLQGEDKWNMKVLRSIKNRFGTINEVGFFSMGSAGLEEVPNINNQLLQDISQNPGSILISLIEGSRPLLIEFQALVLPSKYGMPQRVISGIDQTQIILIAAILEKHLKIPLNNNDLFFKISGGFKIKSAAADLAIALSLLSSYFQKPLTAKSLALGEISLTGHINPVNHISIHIKEAEKFGINLFLTSKNQNFKSSCKNIKFQHVYELLTLFD